MSRVKFSRDEAVKPYKIIILIDGSLFKRQH